MDSITVLAGIPIPSRSPIFLALVGVHVLLGTTCVGTGLLAMLSNKGRGGHSRFGSVYFWCLLAAVVTASALTIVRWREDYPLFVLGALSLVAAYLAREALRRRWSCRARLHVTGMGMSYILLLTAFYVDNGKNLPLWRDLPQIAFWTLPSAIGIPILAYVLRHHSLTRNRLEVPAAPYSGTSDGKGKHPGS